MKVYRVRGQINYEWYCRCEHCLGHDDHAQIDERTEATDEAEAAAQVLRAFQPRESYTKWDDPFWEDDPFVEYLGTVGEDVQMRRQGAPTLPGFEIDQTR